MKLHILTLGRTQIHLHPATLLLAAYMVVCGKLAFFCAAMISILLHEGAHATASWVMGDGPDAIEITPLGAVMRLEDEERLSAGKRFLMLAAGPCMTLLLCASAYIGTREGLFSRRIGQLIFTANTGILLLNLLPCMPLDGGRLLALLLEHVLPPAKTRMVMRWTGIAIGVGCIIISLIVTWETGAGQLTLAACGCVMLYASHISTTTAAMAELAQWMARKIRLEQRGMLPVRSMAVIEDVPLRQAIRRLPPKAWVEIILVEKGTMRYLGTYGENLLIKAYMETPGGSCRCLRQE